MTLTTQPLLEAHLPTGRLLAWEDLPSIPDDQHRAYELAEGRSLVSPASDLVHQTAVLEPAARPRAACPPHLQVVVAPSDVTPADGRSLHPDVLVVDRSTVGRRRAEMPPPLAVEMLLPGSGISDRTLRRAVSEEDRVASCWLVDTDAPSVQVLELPDGRCVGREPARGDDALGVASPFAVTIVTARRVDA